MLFYQFEKSSGRHASLLFGDHVLRQVAKLINSHVRRDDFFARYGGEEFALLLPEISKIEAANLAEKIRELVEKEPFEFDSVRIPITISMGGADLSEYGFARKHLGKDMRNDIDPFSFIKIADDRLFDAKKRGRNRVESM